MRPAAAGASKQSNTSMYLRAPRWAHATMGWNELGPFGLWACSMGQLGIADAAPLPPHPHHNAAQITCGLTKRHAGQLKDHMHRTLPRRRPLPA